MPLVPPVTAWPPPTATTRVAMRMTILPVLRPLCSVRNPSSCCFSMSKLRNGRLLAAAASLRLPRRASMRFHHKGSFAMSRSSAIAQYPVAGDDAAWRDDAQMLRLPISWNAAPSPSNINDAAMKSSERLLRTTRERAAHSRSAAPYVNVSPLRELPSALTPASTSCACLCGRPAVPRDAADSHCAYSIALSPTPPAAACTTILCPA